MMGPSEPIVQNFCKLVSLLLSSSTVLEQFEENETDLVEGEGSSLLGFSTFSTILS